MTHIESNETIQPIVRIYDNSTSNIIKINEDKMLNILNQYGKITDSKVFFITPLSSSISFTLALCTNDFKRFALFTGSEWRFIFLCLALGTAIWTIIELCKQIKNRKKNKKKYIIDLMKGITER